MLQKINGRPGRGWLKIKDAAYPAPFSHTVEYSSPARGSWNIVHTGMLIPESHQIYIAAAGCLRGVILTAAEMGAMNRFSTLEMREEDLVNTDNERFIIDGVTAIINRLPYRPRAVLVFTACVHHFLHCDLRYVYAALRRRFTAIDFAECVMDPIRQTKSMTPEERLRREACRLWRDLPPNPKAVNIIGGNLPLDKNSEIVRLISSAGFTARDMASCASYDEFCQMGEGRLNIYTNPFTHRAARDIAARTGREVIYISQGWRDDDIAAALTELARLILPPDAAANDFCDFSADRKQATATLDNAREIIGDTPVAIDISFTFRPFSLARRLIETGFNIQEIYSDVVPPEDKDDFEFLRQNCGHITLYATKNADMRLKERRRNEKILALGQKAAYFNATPYFVNLIEGGGYFGWSGLAKIGQLMVEAATQPKNTRYLVQQKGWGCPSCL